MSSDLILTTRETFRFNSLLLALGLEDLSEGDAFRRWKDGKGSSIGYLTGHLSSSRVGVLKALGITDENPFKDLYGSGVGSQDRSAYPRLVEVRTGWSETAARLDAALEELTDERALAPATTSFPTSDATIRGQLAFMAWHESYHIGQIGILRTEMGYPSLRQRLINDGNR